MLLLGLGAAVGSEGPAGVETGKASSQLNEGCTLHGKRCIWVTCTHRGGLELDGLTIKASEIHAHCIDWQRARNQHTFLPMNIQSRAKASQRWGGGEEGRVTSSVMACLQWWQEQPVVSECGRPVAGIPGDHHHHHGVPPTRPPRWILPSLIGTGCVPQDHAACFEPTAADPWQSSVKVHSRTGMGSVYLDRHFA